MTSNKEITRFETVNDKYELLGAVSVYLQD